MRYDWGKLRQKFITRSKGNEKYSLKQFAEDEKISYATLRKKAVGWIDEKETRQEQNRNKIIDETYQRSMEKEVEINLHHYDLANKLLEVMEKTFNISHLVSSPKAINTLAKGLKTLQEVQRKASGLDKNQSSGSTVIQDFKKAVLEADANPDKTV